MVAKTGSDEDIVYADIGKLHNSYTYNIPSDPYTFVYSNTRPWWILRLNDI